MSPTVPGRRRPGAAEPAPRHGCTPSRPEGTTRGPLVVVAGIPGAGKSTALRQVLRQDRPDGTRVVDTDTTRRWFRARLPNVPYPALRPLVHTAHWVRIAALAVTAPGPLLVHETATRALSRALLLRLARLARRRAHLIWIDTDPDLARQGQAVRRRVIPGSIFAGHVRRTRRHDPARAAAHAGWDAAERVDRAGAAPAIRAALTAAAR